MGLEWADIDFKNNKIQIRRTSQYVNNHIITKSPKTKSGYRTIDISETVVLLLKNYRTWWLKLRLSMGDLWKETITVIDANGKATDCKNDRLFIKNDSTPMNPDSFTKWFSDFCTDNEIGDFSPQALRHTTVSLLLADNVDLKTVSGVIGHAQTSTTLNIYGHIIDSQKQQAASKLDSRIKSLCNSQHSSTNQDTKSAN